MFDLDLNYISFHCVVFKELCVTYSLVVLHVCLSPLKKVDHNIAGYTDKIKLHALKNCMHLKITSTFHFKENGDIKNKVSTYNT